MKKNKFIFIFLLLCILSQVFAETKSNSPEPYKEDEFPQVLKDIRRFEIITLGSLPFSLMDTNLVFSSIKSISGESGTPSPFPSKTYESTEEFFTDPIIWTSIGISVGIGVTDLIVQIVKRNRQNKKLREKISNDNIKISSIEDNPDAVKIDTNSYERKKEELQ